MIARQPLQAMVVTRDPESTRALARALADAARPGDLISLIGDLGAGKTQFAKGFGAGLGVTDTIVSPTFVLMAEYRGRLPLFHIDLYRLADAAEAMAGGLIDERQSEGVTLIEWAERLSEAMPAGRLDVLIDGTGDDDRTFTLVAESTDYARYLDAAQDYPESPGGAADAQRVATRLSGAADATPPGPAPTSTDETVVRAMSPVDGAADAQRVATRLSGAADATPTGPAPISTDETVVRAMSPVDGAADAQRVATRLSGAADATPTGPAPISTDETVVRAMSPVDGAADAQRVATRLSGAADATPTGPAPISTDETVVRAMSPVDGAADAQRVATRLSGAADATPAGDTSDDTDEATR